MHDFRPEIGMSTPLPPQDQGSLVLVSDVAGNIRAWHNSTNLDLGYGDSEVLGRHISTFICPAESPSLSSFLAIHRDGSAIPMDGVSLHIKGVGDTSPGSVHILRSCAKKHSEITSRTLLRALENSNVLIRRWDGVIEHWSSGCERLYGYTEHEAIGRVGHELLHTDYPQSFEQVQQELKTNGIWIGELKQRHKNGKRVLVSASISRLDPSPGEAPLVVANYSDISPRFEMQQELESANARLKLMAEELERSNEELEEFARIASHDLSSPITSTRWLVEMLSTRHGKQLDADGQRALAQVGTSLERMSDLVEAVLAHAKVGKSPIATLQEADTELALEVALENLRRDISTSGAKVTYDQLPPLLIGQQPLTQLFQNLLSNAVKYRRAEIAPHVHISAVQLGPLRRIAVTDNGMGIEPEWHERIFLPMQRRHSSKIAGSGIGLATCRKIVNRAGGRIWVESELGEGSTFLFTLPGAVSSA